MIVYIVMSCSSLRYSYTQLYGMRLLCAFPYTIHQILSLVNRVQYQKLQYSPPILPSFSLTHLIHQFQSSHHITIHKLPSCVVPVLYTQEQHPSTTSPSLFPPKHSIVFSRPPIRILQPFPFHLPTQLTYQPSYLPTIPKFTPHHMPLFHHLLHSAPLAHSPSYLSPANKSYSQIGILYLPIYLLGTKAETSTLKQKNIEPPPLLYQKYRISFCLFPIKSRLL